MRYSSNKKAGFSVCSVVIAIVVLTGLLPLGATAAAGDADDFPMFRGGRSRTGRTDGGPEPPLELLWKFKTRKGAAEIDSYPSVDDGLSPATVVGGVVYVGGYDGWAYALEAGTGRKIWEFRTGGRINSNPAWNDGLVIFGSMDGFVYALRADDGSLLWKHQTGSSTFRQIAYYGVRTSPVIDDDGVVYTGA